MHSMNCPARSHPRWFIQTAIAGLILILGACRATPSVADSLTGLALAEEMMAQGDWARATDLLSEFEADNFEGEDQERFKLRLARSLMEIGEPWDAFKIIENFNEEHPFGRYLSTVQDIEFKAGAQLIKSDISFWIFSSDEEDGRIILEHFTIHHPRRGDLLPDALRLLGECAFSNEQWNEARKWFQRLISNHPQSEWKVLARFRVAMCRFNLLVGPQYDIEAMSRARNALSDFLELETENPAFVATTGAALRTVERWLALKHIDIAEFYETVGNHQGHIHHLEKAAAEYPETPGGKRAREAIARLKAR